MPTAMLAMVAGPDMEPVVRLPAVAPMKHYRTVPGSIPISARV